MWGHGAAAGETLRASGSRIRTRLQISLSTFFLKAARVTQLPANRTPCRGSWIRLKARSSNAVRQRSWTHWIHLPHICKPLPYKHRKCVPASTQHLTHCHELETCCTVIYPMKGENESISTLFFQFTGHIQQIWSIHSVKRPFLFTTTWMIPSMEVWEFRPNHLRTNGWLHWTLLLDIHFPLLSSKLKNIALKQKVHIS